MCLGENICYEAVGVTGYTKQAPKSVGDVKDVLVQLLKNMREYISKLQKIGGAHLQCVNNHYTKFEQDKFIEIISLSLKTMRSSHSAH